MAEARADDPVAEAVTVQLRLVRIERALRMLGDRFEWDNMDGAEQAVIDLIGKGEDG